MWSCNTEVIPPETIALKTWLNSATYPPSTNEEDLIQRQGQTTVVLPDIKMTVWAVGVITGYMNEHLIYYSDVRTMVSLLIETLGEPPWNDFNWKTETYQQAEHLEIALSMIAYRSPDSNFYAITGNDFIRLLNHSYYARIMDPEAFQTLILSEENISEKIQPLVGYAKEYFSDVRRASIVSRYFKSSAQGICFRAEVRSIGGRVPYIGLAKARDETDAIAAMTLASLKATIRCGINNSDMRDFIYEHLEINEQNNTIVDLFIYHMLHIPHLIYQYIDSCQLPPTIIVTLNKDDCDTSIFGTQ